jgi:hypothetical protein
MRPSDDERALAALLRSGRAEPSVDDLERLERRLSPWLGPPPAAGYAGRVGAIWRSIVFLAALGLLASSDVMRPVPPAAVAHAAQVASPIAAPLSNETHDAPVIAPSSEATVSVSNLPNAPAAVAAKGAPWTPRSKAPPAAVAEPTGAPAAPARPSAPEVSESEASFLRRAQSTLHGDPATALQMLQEHPSRFPQGILVQERDVMAIDALARLGRIDEARARASAFAVRYPRSAHESRIASILKEGTP